MHCTPTVSGEEEKYLDKILVAGVNPAVKF
jgi:hypothetical protein